MATVGADTNGAERTPLLLNAATPTSSNSSTIQPPAHKDANGDEEEHLPSSNSTATAHVPIVKIVLVLLIGVFISNADYSFLMATHPIISSEFNALHDSSWLITSYALASAATQPLYGKLSDIYGRKTLLVVSYTLFAAGCILVGVGSSMSHIIMGRVISGLGSSGMTTLVSILITDLIPLREVAAWRSYVNVVATTGRSVGGPLGGWLADTVGWRWSFTGQAPLAGIAIILIAITIPTRTTTPEGAPKENKLARIDFLGSTMMAMAILSFLFPLEIGGDRLPWSHPIILGLLGAALVFSALFVITEARFAKEPVIPLALLRQKDMAISLFVMVCQAAAQLGMMIAIPLYFQVTSSASSTDAGAHLIPAVFGNAVGGVLSGIVIKKTGRYKLLTLSSLLFGSIGYTLLILRWHGGTNWFESLYIFPGGFGMGVTISTLFVAVQASIDPAHSAVASSSLYLASSIGMLMGMAGTSSVLQGSLRQALERRLGNAGFEGWKKLKIIDRAVSDVHYSDHASSKIAGIVVGSYIEALNYTHLLSLTCSLVAFTGTIFLKEYKL